MPSTRNRATFATAGLALMIGLVAPPASGAPSVTGCATRSLTTSSQLLACLDAADAFVHLADWQAIANANGGTRSSGTPGYDATVDDVVDKLEAAGLVVETQEFAFLFADDGAELLAPTGPYVRGIDFFRNLFLFPGSIDGTGTGPITPVDLQLDIAGQPNDTSTSACQVADFDGFPVGGIALIQRGSCAFSTKLLNAQAAGAVGAVIFNEGNSPSREVLFGIGGDPSGITIPSVSASFAVGVELAGIAGQAVTVTTDYVQEVRSTENVLAELPGRDGGDNVVMIGAHLDSVLAGPGIQDNGSGSAAILALALELAANEGYEPENTLRFAWWGAEEFGLIGSDHYVANLPAGELDDIAAYLNFDMIASPNFVYGVYDADQSSFPAPVAVPPGSEALEDLFERYYSSRGIPYDDTEFSGRSDYQAFIEAGIPSSGLFTGAEVLKTEEQREIWGGVAGEQFDQCYHQACDTIDNVSLEAMEVNIDAVGYAVFHLAASTEAVNQVPGRRAPGPWPAIDGPQFTFVEAGGLDHAHDLASDTG